MRWALTRSDKDSRFILKRIGFGLWGLFWAWVDFIKLVGWCEWWIGVCLCWVKFQVSNKQQALLVFSVNKPKGVICTF